MNKSTITNRTIKGIFWVFLGTVVQGIVQVLALVVLSRLVLPREFGLANAAVIVIGVSTLFSQIGIGPAIVQRPNLEERHIRTGFSVSLLLGLLLTTLTIFFAPMIASLMRMADLTLILQVTAPLFVVQSFFVIPNSILSRNMHFRIQTIVQIVSYAFGYGLVGIILALLKWGVWALVAAQMGQALLGSILTSIFQPYSKKLQIDKQSFKELFYFGGGFTIARIGNYFAGNVDNLVVGRWLGESALGMYSRAFQLIVMPANLFGQVLDTVLFPAMSAVQDSKSRLTSAFRRGVLFITVVVLPISVLSVILAPEIIRIVLGKNWENAIAPFQILSISILFRTSYKMSDSLARATGAVYDRAWRQILFALFVFAGAWIGTQWGLAGVATGVLLATCLNYLFMAHLSLKLISMSWKDFFKDQIPSFGFAVFSSLTIWGVVVWMRAFSASSILVVLTSMLLMGILMGLGLWIKPNFFLGADGLWVLDMLEKNFSTRLPSPIRKFLGHIRIAYQQVETFVIP
jgi:O-antigen/teichoic acid export membrane protein